MTLTTTGIDHVNLQVNNLEESRVFWKNLLGFEVLEEIPSQNGAIIGNHAAKLAIYEKPTLGRVENNGLSHIGFFVSNFTDAVALCEKLSIPVLHGGVVEWPKSRSLYIEDPNGYEIELTDTWGGALV